MRARPVVLNPGKCPFRLIGNAERNVEKPE